MIQNFLSLAKFTNFSSRQRRACWFFAKFVTSMPILLKKQNGRNIRPA
nr:MAG TPA: hypothetical protein [Crassvirales sp.]